MYRKPLPGWPTQYEPGAGMQKGAHLAPLLLSITR